MRWYNEVEVLTPYASTQTYFAAVILYVKLVGIERNNPCPRLHFAALDEIGKNIIYHETFIINVIYFCN